MDSVRLRFIKEYARFDNVEGYKEESNAVISSSIGANNDFDSQNSGSITLQSKMNKFDEGIDFNSDPDEDTPF